MHDFYLLHLFISSSCVASKINDFFRLLVLIYAVSSPILQSMYRPTMF